MKVLLVAIDAKFIHSNLAVKYLKKYTENLDYDCVIKEYSINDRIERIRDGIMNEKPDVVAFSCYIWNIEYVLKLSSLIKIIDDNIEIIYGGPEVSYDSPTYLKSSDVDYIIEGEGEETYKQFIEWKLSLQNINEIKGLYYKDQEGAILFNGKQPLIDMDKVIFPYMDEEIQENKIVYYEGSRGCPFNCKYCLSSTFHGVRFQEIERVKEELQFFMDKGVRLVKFVDRTFNCDTKFAKAIWEYVIEADTNTTFHFEISADLLKEDEFELLKRAPKGRIQFEVGVQTTNPEVLKNINRYVSFEVLKQKTMELKGLNNIKQHLDLIAGLPGEGYDSFIKSFNDVYSIGPEEVQLGFLKLLKGSQMREESEKWGIKYSPYAPYEVLKTKDLTYEELLKLKQLEEMVDKYYNSGKFNSIIKFFITKFKTPFDFYYELAQFFNRKNYFERNISNSDYYKVFDEFAEELHNSNNLHIKEIIKYDYLSFNKRKWLPDFLVREREKEFEVEMKRILKEKGLDPNKIHIEKFKIDIEKFLNSGLIEEKETHFVFVEVSDAPIELQEFIGR